MRGSPLLRACVLIGVIAVLSLPLLRLTQSAQETSLPATPSPATAPSATKTPLVLTFSKAAKSVELKHLGVVVWRKENPALTETMELSVPFPKEGLELGVSARWSGGEPSALRFQLTGPEGVEIERTVWGLEAVETIVPFP